MIRLLSVALLVFLAAADPSRASWRIEVLPADPAEEALRAAVELDIEAERAGALIAVSEQHPGTPTSGLARLAAGFLFVEEDRPEDALAQLSHADVQRTALRDHALLAIGDVQETLERLEPAARSFLGAAAEPNGTVACTALPRGAAALQKKKESSAAALALEETVERCPSAAAGALLDLAEARRDEGNRVAAALALDRLDREYPTSAAAREARPMLRALTKYLPKLSAIQRAERRLHRGEALLEARRTRDALDTLKTVDLDALPPGEVDRARVLLGRALLARRRRTQGRSVLSKVSRDSPWAAEAAWHVARDRARRSRSVAPYVAMADTFPGTVWAQRALRAAADHHQKAARDDEALPYWRRLFSEYPDGPHAESAAWRTGWGQFRAKRFKEAAYTWERTARLRPPGSATPALLYWAGRAHLALGHRDRSRWLLDETVQRFKHSYHGLRAREQLDRLGVRPTPMPPPPAANSEGREASSYDPRHHRLRQLLLIDRLTEAAAELRGMGDAPRVRATLAWVEWRRGRLRPAITLMKRAYPHWVTAAGDHLPRDVWRILFPLRYEEELLRHAREEGLDPSLVAGLILQESNFDPAAVSRVGARGLMQIMPATGREIARQKRVRYRTSLLHDPNTSLDFGTFYLRRISDRFDGAVDKVLVGYNAGPRRVDRWTSLRPGLPEEEFIETIPFTETRFYVRLVLANREEYRRLYGLGLPGPAPANGGAP